MAMGIASATTKAGANTFAVCPTWQNGACACPKDANGSPEATAPLLVAHPAYAFGAAPPSGWSMPNAPAEYLALGKTQAQWAALTAAQQWGFTCAVEAIRIVKHDLATAAGGTAVSALVGVTA